MAFATTLNVPLCRLACVALAAGAITLLPAVAGLSPATAARTYSADTGTANVNEAKTVGTDVRAINPVKPAEISNEYPIKAAFLYNFAKLTEWPAVALSDAAAPLSICVLGTDPFGTALAPLQGKPVKNRPLVTTSITKVEDAVACAILFVSASEEKQLPAILDYVASLPILTVSDMPLFSQAGGIIALKNVKDRIRFEINIPASHKAGLKFNTVLLQLADPVSTANTATATSHQ